MRRGVLKALIAIGVMAPGGLRRVWADGVRYPPVTPDVPLALPPDEAGHPAFRTEWWYVTGWLKSTGGGERGFQVTFFRVRTLAGEGNPSAFAPRQLLFAHAAVADPVRGRLLHDQRAARQGFGLASASDTRLEVRLGNWQLQREAADGQIRTRIPGAGFTLDLRLRETSALLLHGPHGVSRKGPDMAAASYYYSHPHLDVSGTLALGGTAHAVSGTAWMDHEWSNSYLDAESVGWDWAGINLSDGEALMVFRMRTQDGSVRWAGGTYRSRAGDVRHFSPAEVRLVPRRIWRSPRTGAGYPVAMDLILPDRTLTLEPMMDDQELDSSASTGVIYWEGAVRALDGQGNLLGHGYMELTGYASRLRF